MIETAHLFSEMSAASKVWIYTSNKAISTEESLAIQHMMNEFVNQWQAHQQKVFASGSVLFHRFLVLAADSSKTNVSGCSIDESIHFVQEVERKFNLHFFDRLYTCCLQGNTVKGYNQAELIQAILSREVNADTLLFNPLVNNLNELRHSWMIPLRQSWQVRLLPAQKVD